MSKAPTGSVKAYDGSGDWFKIGQTGVCNQSGDFTTNAWCSWDKNTLTATIPKNTPSGEYLLRVEHIGKLLAASLIQNKIASDSSIQAFTGPTSTNPSTSSPAFRSR
jgi:hypothetical protein